MLSVHTKIDASLNLLNFQGRGFNVQIHYVEEPVADYLRAAVSTVLSIHDKVTDIWMILICLLFLV